MHNKVFVFRSSLIGWRSELAMLYIILDPPPSLAPLTSRPPHLLMLEPHCLVPHFFLWQRSMCPRVACIVHGTSYTTAKIISTQIAQTSAERQHNRIAEWLLQCKLAMQLWSESTRYFFDNPVSPDFGLRTPASGWWSEWSPQFNILVPGSTPVQEISSKSVHIFFSYPTDRQTVRD